MSENSESTAVKQEMNGSTGPIANGHSSENSDTKLSSVSNGTNDDGEERKQPSSNETEVKKESDVGNEDASQNVKMEEEEEDDDEEDKLFNSLEEVQNKEFDENAKHEAKAAPKLLQGAINSGAIKEEEEDDDAGGGGGGNDEEKKENEASEMETDSPNKAKDGSDVTSSPSKKEDETEEERLHRLQNKHRVNQLDFLLNKASEYSNFIAQDLEELQAQMSAEAAAKVAAQQAKVNKKRKKAGGATKGEEQLMKAQAKHAGTAGQPKAIFTQPPNLAAGCQLKDYQLEGVRWLTSLYENGVSGILADEMGLGKTIQVIALVAHLQTMKVTGPFMVVAPLATIPNWEREFKKWLPTLPVIRFHGNGAEREAMLKGPLYYRNRKNPKFPVIVTSYEVAIRDQAKLSKLGEFTYVIVDEGQRLKNHRCCLITNLKKIPASNRLLLSGTPIQNNLDELWSLLNFVNPQIFDDLSVFQSWFGFRDIGKMTKEDEIVQKQREQKTVSKLHDILRPFLLRRVKTDVLTDLPPKKEVVVYAGMSKLQSGYADLIENGTIKELLLQQGIEDARELSQTNKQMNHRKNSNHPFLFGEPIDSATGMHLGTAHPQLLVRASGKFALLDRMLERLFQDGHQVLIFSQMTRVLNIMEDYLLWRKWRYCRIDGSTKIDERQRQMDVFNAEKSSGKDGGRNEAEDRFFCFLLSTRAGGLGINLASADTCIIFDSDWNPHQDSQAMDRCHRIGQTRPVAVYRLLTTGSVDIDMMEKQISKKKLERMAIVGGDFRRAGQRSRGDFCTSRLTALLADDIKDLQGKGLDVEHIKISDEELDAILDRKRLFATGKDAIPTEGKMYDVVEGEKSNDLLGSVNS